MTSNRLVVTALVVTYNSASEIDALLDSLPAAAEGLDLRVLVVDNSSSDDTVARVEARGDARVVASGGNVGYAAGINVGRENLDPDTDALAILNPDLVLEPGALRLLVEPLVSDRTIGVTVPHVSNSDGSPFHSLRREPRLLSQLGEMAFGSHWASRPAVLGDALRRPEHYATGRDVEWASGAALVISRACNDTVGEWREDFFLYSEETDFARRARQAGYRIRYVPEARCLHIGGASGSSPKLEALMEVNKLRDYEANHNPVSSVAFRGVLAAQHALRARSKPGSKLALRHLLQRSSWDELPAGEPRIRKEA
ncbi:glycosyltransferase family 2 protein [Luteococcus peritonei]|uniref:Glycosyltransferase family 2 protein n=1 Tax=Luteococcus peritonei TaxID=88874 RepID=A0ABW4RV29_9ACTN